MTQHAAAPEDALPAITVVVPTRDRPDMLRATLAAIEAQDYPGRVDTIVVFDQSDPDLSLMRDSPRRAVSVVGNTCRQRLAGARNSGILAADTPLVAFCDDDDVWHPERVAVQVRAMQADPGATLMSCGIRVRYQDRDVVRSLPAGRVELSDLLRSRLTELHPSTFLLDREQLLGPIGLVDEEIPGSYAEDYEFLLRIARHGRIRNVPDVLVDVRWHQQSYFTQRWQTIATALSWLLDRYPEFADEPRGRARVQGQIAFAEAAGGHRRAAARASATALRSHPLEPRAFLALAVASGALTPERVLRTLHRRGRGI